MSRLILLLMDVRIVIDRLAHVGVFVELAWFGVFQRLADRSGKCGIASKWRIKRLAIRNTLFVLIFNYVF